MMIGNRPEVGVKPKHGKLYWWISCGRDAISYRYFDGGWRAFEACAIRYNTRFKEGAAQPYIFRIAFAFWLPFYKI